MSATKKQTKAVAQRLAKAKKPSKAKAPKKEKPAKVKGKTTEEVITIPELPIAPVAVAKADEAAVAITEGVKELPYYRYYLEDEAPQIGSGVRAVLIVRSGPKWTKMLDPNSCLTDEVPTDDFRANKRKQLMTYMPKDMIAKLLRSAKDYDRYSATVRDALLDLGAKKEQLPDFIFSLEKPEKEAKEPKAPREPAKTVAEILAAMPADDGTEPKPSDGEGSGKFIMRVWMLNRYTPEQIVGLIHKNYPGRTTKVSDVKYNYNKLAEAGTANLPPWPAKAGKAGG